MTLEEFLAWEELQPTKHEFVDGEIFEVNAMVGARRIHVEVTMNVGSLLKAALRGTPCRAYITDLKLVVATNIYYPDILVTCHADDLAADFAVAHPKVIIEVLSDSTAAYDRGDKFAAYRKIPDLEEYALIDPDRRSIEVFRRADGGDWLLMASEAPRGLVLKSLDFVAAPEAVFENLDN
ncbi:MAG: Uma2 family endonuclease [Rhodocyclales bacterium]|nr:Uma2 family endonuclease [Rhodocyclales bacterium]